MTNPTNGNLTNIVAIANLPEGTSAGELSFLSVHGPIDNRQLEEEWAARGLDPKLLPRKTTEEAALRKAMFNHKAPSDMLRPLKKSDDAGRGWALVDEHATGDDTQPLGYDVDNMVVARIVYDISDPTEAKPTVKFSPESWKHADSVRAQFDETLNYLISPNTGNWVWHVLARSLGAVRLREDGGFCYIPPENVEQWNIYRDVIHTVSQCKVYGIDALQSEGVVEAVLDGITREAQKAVKEWAEELERTGDKALGASALRTRESKSSKLRDKVRYYEALCSQALPELQEQMDELDTDITAALLLADPDDGE